VRAFLAVCVPCVVFYARLEGAEQRAKPVAIVCVECGDVSVDEADGWRAYLTDDDPPEVANYCPDCAREVDDQTASRSRADRR
jgi:hypothetical protein